ncbi:hypothetical protein DY000_02048823 [Brassica cretica]|uniref:Uncharacterized protein n=1 Tax=Brassica cretica TaxID=69181 RepID=A0ABQ7FBU3_BRACR|nr:hypothetical protein DY000_02048823 [Brassica cretica]
MAEMKTKIESMQHILEKEATTSPSIDANKATSIDVKPQTSQIPAEPESLAEKKDECHIDRYLHHHIDRQQFAAMEDRLQTYEDMHNRFTSPIMRYLDTLSTQMMNVQRDIGTLNDQHDFQEECSTLIDRFRRASLEVKKPTEHLPYTAAEVDQITSKLYTAIDTMEDRFERRCDDIYFPFDVRLSGLDSHAEWLQKEVKAFRGNSHLNTRYQHQSTENPPNRSTVRHQHRPINTWSHRSIPRLHQTPSS